MSKQFMFYYVLVFIVFRFFFLISNRIKSLNRVNVLCWSSWNIWLSLSRFTVLQKTVWALLVSTIGFINAAKLRAYDNLCDTICGCTTSYYIVFPTNDVITYTVQIPFLTLLFFFFSFNFLVILIMKFT